MVRKIQVSSKLLVGPKPLMLEMLVFCSVCLPVAAQFVRVPSGVTALTHVRVIDGTGSAATSDQTIIIDHGQIREIGDASQVKLDGVTRTLDLSGRTALPGLVGMHDHLFYAMPPGAQPQEMLTTFPKLYLAAGVTSVRTAGTLDLDAELQLKRRIDQEHEIGPHLYLSSPYIEPDPTVRVSLDMAARVLSQVVELVIAPGINSVKAYTHARPSDLEAIIQTAHRHGVRVTGHLCATGFTEAAALGIDNLEHGLAVDTEFYSGRQPGICSDWVRVVAELVRMNPQDPQIHGLIETLIKHHVAITSTLPVLETLAGSRASKWDERTVVVLSPQLQYDFKLKQNDVGRSPDIIWGRMLQKEMEFEREFVKAGGLLLAGVDPTGWGGVVAGFGDQRELELLVEAGFTPEQAIHIATNNAATFLGEADRFGTLSAGKRADVVVVQGDPATHITDIRRTEIVFKDGIGYDSAALLQSLNGQVGR